MRKYCTLVDGKPQSVLSLGSEPNPKRSSAADHVLESGQVKLGHQGVFGQEQDHRGYSMENGDLHRQPLLLPQRTQIMLVIMQIVFTALVILIFQCVCVCVCVCACVCVCVCVYLCVQILVCCSCIFCFSYLNETETVS